jgi:hypothetical protein
MLVFGADVSIAHLHRKRGIENFGNANPTRIDEVHYLHVCLFKVQAVMACSQMLMGASAGIIVSYSYDEKTSWAMTLWMMFYVFAAALTYLIVVRPAEHHAA